MAGQLLGDQGENVVIGFDRQGPLIGTFNGNDGFVFLPFSFLPAGKTVVVGDINGDGLADIGVFDSNTGFHYAIQDESGNFTAYNTNVGPIYNVVSAAMLVDVNGDFKPDLVFVSGGNGAHQALFVALNTGQAGHWFTGQTAWDLAPGRRPGSAWRPPTSTATA